MAQTLLVEDLMTRAPHTIEVSKTLADAARLMQQRGIRHVPVMDQGALVGLISEHDVRWFEAHGGQPADELPLATVMARSPWTVAPSTPVEVAARHMAEHKLGSSVVLENEQVVGIFTSTDGLRALAKVLAEERARG